MNNIKIYWAYSFFFKILVFIWTGVIFFLSFNSLENINFKIKVSNADKLAHFLLYFVYAFLLVFSFKNLKSKKLAFFGTIFLYVFLLGLAIEFLQGFTKNRSSEVLDVLSNGLGAFTGVCCASLIIKNKIILQKNKVS